jgi:hypothetical protein
VYQLRLAALSFIAIACLSGSLFMGSCRRVPREMERWNLPADFDKHQATFRTLTLPREVTRFDWLSSDLEHLEARGSVASVVRGFPDHLESLDLSYSEVRFLAGLPSGLRRLDLRFTNLTRVPDLPDGLAWLALGGDAISTLDGVPPDLRELVLEEAPQLARLRELPPDLESLTLIGTSFTDLRSLPPNLHSLTLQWTGIKTLAELPDSLQSLTLEGNLQLGLRKDDLPHFLTTLSVEGTVLPDLSHLPYLVELEVNPWDPATGQLPRSLRTLRLTGSEIPQQLQELPALRSLRVVRSPGSSANLELADASALPANLEILDLAGFLPPQGTPLTSLRHLDLSWMPLDRLPSLPPSLETLDISATNITDLAELPGTLSSLRCRRTMVTELLKLPRSIVSLDLAHSSKYVQKKDVKLTRILNLNLRGTALPSLADLPRSIRVLDVSETQISSLQGVPPNLQELTVCSGQISSLAHLPDSVRTLRFVEPLEPEVLTQKPVAQKPAPHP